MAPVCQTSECSAKGCRLAYLGLGKGFQVAGANKYLEATASRSIRGPVSKERETTGGRVNIRAPGPEWGRSSISSKCTPNNRRIVLQWRAAKGPT